MSEDPSRQAIVDQEHLKLLSIAYLVSSGLSACFSLLGLLYAGMGVFMGAMIARAPATPGQAPPPEFMGWLFGLMGLSMFVIMMTMAALKLLAYRRLKARRSRTFCMVVAGLTCLGMPYGALLGVFTFVVLTRPSVARLFEVLPPPIQTPNVVASGG